MRHFYRGWTVVDQFEQIAEREAWMQEGWDWFTYPRTAHVTRKGLKGLKRVLYPILRLVPLKQLRFWLEIWTSDASWADVEVSYLCPQGKALYQVRIEESGAVMSARKSAAKANQKVALAPVKQYRVSHFK